MDPRLSNHVRENKITRASRQLQYARRYPEAHEPFPTTRPRSTDSAVPSLAPHPPVHAANPLRERIVTPKIQGLTFSIPFGVPNFQTESPHSDLRSRVRYFLFIFSFICVLSVSTLY